MDSRIVHIDGGLEWRGGQRQLFLLATEQRTRGSEPFVAAQPRSPLVVRLRGVGTASRGVRMRGVWHLTAARRLRRIIRTWRARIVHAHDLRSFALAQSALVGLSEIVLILTCRTVPPRYQLLRQLRQRPARFIVPNREVGGFLASLDIPADRIDIIAPAVPLHGDVRPRNWKSECRWPSEALLCGVIGASRSSAQSQLRDIMSHIPAPLRARIRLLLLGRRFSGSTRIGGVQAFGVGIVDEIAPAIAGCDMLCNLSGTESMNTAVLDAMALGVPPVAFDSGGVSDYIDHGRSGLVVPAGDTVAFAEAMSSLIRNEELADTLAAFGPGSASRFSVGRMASQTEAVYERALGARRAAAPASLTQP